MFEVLLRQATGRHAHNHIQRRVSRQGFNSVSDRQTSSRWIAFDAVGTLIHADPSVADVYLSIGQRFGVRHERGELKRRFSQAMASRPGDQCTDEVIEREFWKRTVADVLGQVNDPEDCFAELYAHFARPDSWRLAEGAVETLRELKRRGFRLAIASNFDRRLRQVLAGFPGLSEIDLCIISSEVGWRKPHRQFFEALICQAGCRPDRIVMLGDDYQLDVLSARACGLRAVHLSANAGSPGEVDRLSTLAELLDWSGLND